MIACFEGADLCIICTFILLLGRDCVGTDALLQGTGIILQACALPWMCLVLISLLHAHPVSLSESTTNCCFGFWDRFASSLASSWVSVTPGTCWSWEVGAGEAAVCRCGISAGLPQEPAAAGRGSAAEQGFSIRVGGAAKPVQCQGGYVGSSSIMFTASLFSVSPVSLHNCLKIEHIFCKSSRSKSSRLFFFSFPPAVVSDCSPVPAVICNTIRKTKRGELW